MTQEVATQHSCTITTATRAIQFVAAVLLQVKMGITSIGVPHLPRENRNKDVL
jgi:hypothetical protein